MEGIAPLIAGRRYSYASIELAVAAGATAQQLFLDVSAINYAEALEIAFRNGTSRVPVGSTSGVWTPQEGSLVLGKSTFAQFITKIGPGWLGINLLMVVAFADIGEPITTDTINARIVGRGNSHQSGPEALEEELRFMTTSPLLCNGVPSMLNRVF